MRFAGGASWAGRATLSPVSPAPARIQFPSEGTTRRGEHQRWIPACAGMTPGAADERGHAFALPEHSSSGVRPARSATGASPRACLTLRRDSDRTSGDGETWLNRVVRVMRHVSPPQSGFWAVLVRAGLPYALPPCQPDGASGTVPVNPAAKARHRADGLRPAARRPERANGQRLLLQDHRTAHWTHRTWNAATRAPPDLHQAVGRSKRKSGNPLFPTSLRAPAGRLQPRFGARMGEAPARSLARG